MGRPESPITGDGPVAELARALRALRKRANLSYREMGDRPRCLSRFTLLAQAASGQACPTWQVLCEYVTACGEQPADWRELWERARKAPRRRRAAPRQTPAASAGTAATRTPVKRPAPPAAPDPWQAGSAREYVLALRELRAWSGQRSFYDVADAAGARLAKSTMYDALNPNRDHLPPLEIVRAVVAACHADVETWTQAWQQLRLEEHRQAPLPARPSNNRRDSIPQHPGPDTGRTHFTTRDIERLNELLEEQKLKDLRWAAFDAALEEFENLRTTTYPGLPITSSAVPGAVSASDPEKATTPADFVQQLKLYWHFKGGPSIEDMEKVVKDTRPSVGPSTFFNILYRRQLPTVRGTRAFIIGCGGTKDEVEHWLHHRSRIRAAEENAPDNPDTHARARA